MKEHTNIYDPSLIEDPVTEELLMDSHDEPAARAVQKAGIVLAASMIALGFLASFVSLPLGIGLGFITTIGLGIYSVALIVSYIQDSRENRSGRTLAGGIILLLFSLLMLWSSLGTPYGSLRMISVITSLIGFFTLTGGIEQIRSYMVLRKEQTSGAGWLLTGGILNLLLSVFMITMPVFTWFTMTAIWGFYFLITGISLLADALSGRQGLR